MSSKILQILDNDGSDRGKLLVQIPETQSFLEEDSNSQSILAPLQSVPLRMFQTNVTNLSDAKENILVQEAAQGIVAYLDAELSSSITFSDHLVGSRCLLVDDPVTSDIEVLDQKSPDADPVRDEASSDGSQEPETLSGNSGRIYTCTSCRSHFQSPEKFEIHVQSCSKKPRYKCRHAQCEKKFSSVVLARQHYNTAHLRQSYICGVDGCQNVYKHKQTRQEHITRDHNRVLVHFFAKICIYWHIFSYIYHNGSVYI